MRSVVTVCHPQRGDAQPSWVTLAVTKSSSYQNNETTGWRGQPLNLDDVTVV